MMGSEGGENVGSFAVGDLFCSSQLKIGIDELERFFVGSLPFFETRKGEEGGDVGWLRIG